jgi:hypothetical protein
MFDEARDLKTFFFFKTLYFSRNSVHHLLFHPRSTHTTVTSRFSSHLSWSQAFRSLRYRPSLSPLSLSRLVHHRSGCDTDSFSRSAKCWCAHIHQQLNSIHVPFPIKKIKNKITHGTCFETRHFFVPCWCSTQCCIEKKKTRSI